MNYQPPQTSSSASTNSHNRSWASRDSASTDASRGSSVNGAIHAELPVEDEELKRIVGQFVDRLEGRIDGIQSALEARDFVTVRKEAHWLKGSGGTVGFPQFTTPACQLEVAAIDEDVQIATKLLSEINGIRSRLVKPVLAEPGGFGDVDGEPSGDPAECMLPIDDPDFRRIVDGFLSQLDQRMLTMLKLVQDGAFEDLLNESLWLARASEAAGFPGLTLFANKLESAVRRRDVSSCQKSLQQILEFRQRIKR
ncbi:MAG: Hpt domain-containing protein [Planctomycetota bacterium]